MRVAIVLDGETPINSIVLGDGAEGDEWLALHPDAIETTGLENTPGVGVGWKYVDGEWIAPEPPEVIGPDRDTRLASVEKLRSMGFTDEEIISLVGPIA